MDATTRAREVDEYFSAVALALRRTAYLVVWEWHTAEDMVQTTFVKLYLAWPRISKAGLEAYTRRTLIERSLSN